MKAIILAAGQGSRLKPYTDDRPKCLVEVDQKALLDYQLDVLRSEGIFDIVIVKGYLADTLVRPEVRTYIKDSFGRTNMVWTLFTARPELFGDVIVAYGDIVYSRENLRMLLASHYDIAVAVDNEWEPYWRIRFQDPLPETETLKLDDRGRIADIGQRPRELDEVEGQYIGLMKFTDAGLATLRHTFDRAVETGDLGGNPPEKAYMTDLLQAIIKAGHDVWPVFIRGGWVEVDTVRDLELQVTVARLRQIAQSTH